MKLITLATLYLATLVFGQYSPIYVCNWQDSDTEYDLSPLYRGQGNAYAAKDGEGNVIYLNICGSLENLEEISLGCDPSAGACFVSESGIAVTVGRPENGIEVDSSVVVSLPNGDSCPLSSGVTYATTLYLACGDSASDGTPINFVNITYYTCSIEIYGTSPYACGFTAEPSTSTSQYVPAPILLGFVTLFCCSACLCVCACHRRRRCRQQNACKRGVELNAVTYQQVPQQQPQPQQFVQMPRPQPVVQHMPQIPQMPVPIAAPYVPMNPMQQQHPGMVPQQFQPVPPVYFNQPYFAYPPQQQQQQQRPQFAFAPPLTQANNNVVMIRENQLTEDERIARELQSKFDNE